MNEQGKISFIYSWPAIILALWIFWPIGIFLIIKRVSIDKKASLVSGKIFGILGIIMYVITGFFGLCAVICLADMSDPSNVEVLPIFLVMAIIFGIGGFALQKVSKKIKKEAEDIKKYLSVIINGNERRIDVIASSLGKSCDVAKNDIQKMIQKGYLKNAYINEATREVVLTSNNTQNQETAIENTNVNKAKIIVACQCCGANNTVFGNSGECEYCGSALNVK